MRDEQFTVNLHRKGTGRHAGGRRRDALLLASTSAREFSVIDRHACEFHGAHTKERRFITTHRSPGEGVTMGKMTTRTGVCYLGTTLNCDRGRGSSVSY